MKLLKVLFGLSTLVLVGCSNGTTAAPGDALASNGQTSSASRSLSATTSSFVNAYTYYVSPDGAGTSCTASYPCQLETAKSVVRAQSPSINQDIAVSLADGVYELAQALTFDQADSGKNGHTIAYVAAPGARPVISGGRVIQGWTLVDPQLGVYQAAVPVDFNTRQLYVNGERAERTKLLLNDAQGLIDDVSVFGGGYRLTLNSAWRNVQDIEVVARAQWMNHRCPIQSIANGGYRHLLSMSNGDGLNDAVLVSPKDQGQNAQTYSGDYDGDGRDDLLFASLDGSGTSHYAVALSNGAGFAAAQDWLVNQGQASQTHVGDYNGDGRVDLLLASVDTSGVLRYDVALSTGAGFATPQGWLSNQKQATQAYVGDYNGDGRDDLLLASVDASGTSRYDAALSTGAGFATPQGWLSNQGQVTQTYIGDYNGDGRDDLLLASMDASGISRYDVALSTGAGFVTPQGWLSNQKQAIQAYVGDYNGDGRDDLLFAGFDAGAWRNAVALSNGVGFAPAEDWLINQGQDTEYKIGDFNGDKKTDLLFSYAPSELTIQNPCWRNANRGPSGAKMRESLSWIENVYELLNRPGQWYLDRSRHLLFYIPRPGEDINSSVIVAPKLDRLIEADGAHDLEFSGITFAYAGWLEPGSSYGYAALQAGTHFSAEGLVSTPGNVSFSSSFNIVFTGNQFLHLGGAALNFADGSHDVEITGNTFADISSGGLWFGDTRLVSSSSYVTVSNNYFTKTGVEYEDSVPIAMPYVAHANIIQNEIDGAPYTGISVGWGWSAAQTYVSNNAISQNWVHGVMQKLLDGGGIYTLSSQPGSTLSGNLVEQVGPASCAFPDAASPAYFGIYHDNGSRYYYDTQNVVRSSCAFWLMLQGGSASDTYDTVLDDNYVDQDIVWCQGHAGNSASCGFNGNRVTNVGSASSDEAAAIIESAGISEAYQFAKFVRSGPLVSQ
ncbi:MAG: FG-GAP-like repeat-containing protein [Steroidobacteraceae bacterium]